MGTVLKIVVFLICMLSLCESYAQEQRTIKRKVAIARFTNETQYAKGLFYDRENDPMQKQAMDILSAKLAASQKFILLERSDIASLVSEGGAAMNKIGADYVIVGSITEYGRKTSGQQKVFSSTKTQVVEAGISIRLVEVATGLIIYSEEAKGYAETTTKQSMGLGGAAGFDATLSDKAISAAMSQLVENVIDKCMDKPWRSYVLSVDNDAFIIGGGASQGLQVGDVFSVYQKGREVVNPQTGVKIELPGTKVGQVQILSFYGTTAETEISFCEYAGETLDSSNLSNYYIQN